MPSPLVWKKLQGEGDFPNARSGHSFTFVKGNYIYFGGLDCNKKNGKVRPNNDVHTFKIGASNIVSSLEICHFNLEKCSGDIPPARTNHRACAMPGDGMFIFGGHFTNTQRLNDAYCLDTKNFVWRLIPGSPKEPLPNNDHIEGWPDARANHSLVLSEDGKIYMFGGHGGANFQRQAFNDLWVFDCETEKWTEILPQNNPPQGRGGHTSFILGTKFYVYGGWNSNNQFENALQFDLETKQWSDPDVYMQMPRWNHSGIMVEAIPSWKYFIFGGSQGDFPENGPRNFGTFANESAFLDVATMKWYVIEPEDMNDPNFMIPRPRENATMAYDDRDNRLIVFGGWADTWIGDIYALNVSSIVGPPYAITAIEPNLGQLSGNTEVVVKGVGFIDTNNINVRFGCGKQFIDVPGTYLNDNELTCMTPNFEHIGPKDAEVRLSIQNRDYSITMANFSYFMNTRAYKSLFYGPGLLQDCVVGIETSFIIQARNDLNENRSSGRDRFSVKIRPVKVKQAEELEAVEEQEGKQGDEEVKEEEAPKVEEEDVPVEIVDNDNGTYTVKYKVEHPGEVDIDVLFLNDKGKQEKVRGSPSRVQYGTSNPPSANQLTGSLMQKYISKTIEEVEHWEQETAKGCQTKDKNVASDVKQLISVKDAMESVHKNSESIVLKLDVLDESLKMFHRAGLAKDSEMKKMKKLFDGWTNLQKIAKETKREIMPYVQSESERNVNQVKAFEEELKHFHTSLKKRDFYFYKTGVEPSLQKLEQTISEIKAFEDKQNDLGYNAQKFGQASIIENSQQIITTLKAELESMRGLWLHIQTCSEEFQKNMKNKWLQTNAFDLEEDVKKLFKKLKDMKVDRKCNAYLGISDEIKKWLTFLPLVGELRDDSMRDRHWDALRKAINGDFVVDERLLLEDIYNLQLHRHVEAVEEITDQARQEAKMEKTLNKLEEIWSVVEFEMSKHKDTDVMLLKVTEENFEMLEENQVAVNSMFSSRFLSTFEDRCVYWQKSLASISEVVQIMQEVQRSWSFLENLFIHSEEVKKELPEQSDKFVGIDKEVKDILRDGANKKKCLDFCIQENIFKRLEEVQNELKICEKALNDFLDGKRRAFPRFYFVSTTDLLDILSNGNNPPRIMRHMPKIFQAIKTLNLKEGGGDARPSAIGMETCVGKEYVDFSDPLQLMGKVERYLQDVVKRMQESLHKITEKSLKTLLGGIQRKEWIVMDPTQVTLTINLIKWVINVEKSFDMLKSNKAAISQAYTRQVDDLTGLIKMVQGKLDKPVRQKVMCLITMDTHSRDIIQLLERQGVTRADEFQWQSQLKAYWDYDQSDARLNVADAQFWYAYEYLGNGPRLVVTPLTDRIYVTATQALHLKMGCSPAGPAGTGKTETTKDLAAANGKPCYVFNCSDQMDYQSMGNIYKGLASSGAWGCFDEFNRLVPEVLSVCSVQFKAVTDAIKYGAKRFTIEGDEISLDPTCGVFITMNPGYLGRSELPEGLKSLFRPITVVVPDLELICENMLMAQGFVGAKLLARKFTTLYALCKDLLSKQLHYDWGLRAIKSVLVVAGGFKRGEPDLDEEALLMRALRDFNLPKIVIDDLEIFMGLLGDLFPGIDVPRKVDMDFETIVNKAAADFNYWPEPEFILKVVQLKELLEIRHCVFIMGPPGSGKSSTWKTLARSQDKSGQRTTYVDINPKTVSTNELYGYVQLSTREWKDGLLSKTLRSLGEINDINPKWLVLDGDLDTVWIESMNSVMDDNKILTLASNERIPLKEHMRMLFEIRDLRFATPATVSRAGILYISDTQGYQWRAYVSSWVAKQKVPDDIKEGLQKLFDKYIGPTLTHMKKSYKFAVPMVEISMVVSLCMLLESIMANKEIKGLEYLFVFCCVWALGGGYMETDGLDYRREFSSWWKNEWKTIKFPSKGTVFDYYVDLESVKFEEWNKLQSADIDVDTSKPIADFTVPTPEVVSAHYLMKAFVNVNHPPLLLGNAGCGKTQITKGLLNDLQNKTDVYIFQVVNFNYYTDSPLLQNVLEQPLEKKAGRTYAPQGKYKLIYFVDDLNMPMLDDYDTQSAVALLRQHADYGHWYDRVKMQIMDITNTLYVAAMNPTAGSFFVNPRLQRHFWLLAVNFPEQSSLFTIYSTFLNKHFSKFKSTILELVAPIIKTGLTLHQLVVSNFRKTAINFHYQFNIRHLSNIFQGLLVAQPGQFQEPEKLVRLWVHESERIYGDRMVTVENINSFRGITADLVKKSFARFNLARYFQQQNPEPLIFSNFANGLQETQYDQFANITALSNTLQEALREYNDTNATMDLVLFEDAMKHVCRISRIIASSAGHALLVGVGGSGKQSLSRLSSFICNYSTTQIMISQSYGIPDLKEDLQKMYKKTGVKDEGLLFLFTQGQISNERFLVYINDLLSSGDIADLFAPEDQDEVVNNVRSAVRGAGIQDNKTNCWNFFIGRVRNNLHMALCFSPVGDNFRNRSRKFPALVNTTVIDWFQPWPYEALLSVADKFLAEIDLGTDDVRDAVVRFMPYSFEAVNLASDKILDMERRYVYTTPKSFLELIKLFKTMLGKKRNELEEAKGRYETGVVKIKNTQEVVGALEDELKVKEVEVKEKKEKADAQAEIVGREKAKVEIESNKANAEAKVCAEIQEAVEAKMASVQKDLDEALPLVERAQEALKGLDIGEFRMMKSFTTPPKEVGDVFSCVISLMQGLDPTIEVDKRGVAKDRSWKQALKLMAQPQQLIDRLEGFKETIDKGLVPGPNFKGVRPNLADPNFNKDYIKTKSSAAGGLCDWVINITQYYDVVIGVEPKKKAVAQAKQQLADATEKKERSDALVAKLMEELGVLQSEFQKAMDEKQQAEDEANRCQRRLGLANRLINALGSEYERWGNSIEEMDQKLSVIVGDVLIASAFVSYVGPFNKFFRDMIISENFMKFFKENNIPMGEEPNPLQILTDEASIAEWNNQKLPSDQVSVENGAILTNSERWPLIIDPQLQGITWIRNKEKDHNLQITRLTNSKMIRTMEQCLEQGWSILIENMDEQIDAVLAPVIGRNTIRRGRTRYIQLGDKEIILSPEFKLFMHTKLSNPHYPPEIQAEATLINFTVTENGLEDQILDLVVRKERPDLASKKEFLIKQQNDFKIQLKKLELELLFQLTNAEGDILENITLIENLEYSKKLSTEISEKVEIAKVTSVKINDASEAYRPAANRGALVFFMMNELYKIHTYYMFSLDSFVIVVKRAIDIVAAEYKKEEEPEEGEQGEGEAGAEGEEKKEEAKQEGEAAPEQAAEEDDDLAEPMTPRTLKGRVERLVESITFEGFNFTRRGLFERHKLLVATMLCLRVLVRKGICNQDEVNHLISKKVALDPPQQPDSLRFIPEPLWPACKGLEQVHRFSSFTSNLGEESLHWRKWYGEEKAEVADLPKAYRDVTLFHRLLILRTLRPDRIPNALVTFINDNMGVQFTEQEPFSMEKTYSEMGPKTPIFFVLFPGVDPTLDVERVGATLGVSQENGKFFNISMGQGQEEIAIKRLHKAAEEGTWIMLQNVHLMQTWLKTFERQLEIAQEACHDNFRVFISAEPPPLPDMKFVPESVLQGCIKVSNEAAQDLKANLKHAFSKFTDFHFDRAKSHKYAEFKALLFGLCMFHSLILGRRKFGSQGWSRSYNFNDGDLTICADVLNNYLSKYEKVPYDDIRYIYGEIMYGGHITDNWDRRTNSTYLEVIIKPEILTNANLAPGFKSPDPNKFEREAYDKYIDEKLPLGSPQMFGMHPNAEINFLTQQCDSLFNSILLMSSSGGGGGGKGKDAMVKDYINRFLEQIPKDFNLFDLAQKIKVKDPYVNVALQECERMNGLLHEIRKSLSDLDSGLKGQLNITDAMEVLSTSLSLNNVPRKWELKAYFSKKSLLEWFADLLQRVTQLEEWVEEFQVPKSLWISGLFNPMSFLTAVMQVTAREKNLPLDSMCLKTDVTNIISPEDIPGPAPVGQFLHGFFLEGAAWEMGRGNDQGNLTEQQLKELHPALPVMQVSAIQVKDMVKAGFYECPTYVTSMRGPTYVFTAHLKMESEDFDHKIWILSGVALLMSDD